MTELSPDQVRKLQVAYEEGFGKKLSKEDAEALGLALVNLFGPLVREAGRQEDHSRGAKNLNQ